MLRVAARSRTVPGAPLTFLPGASRLPRIRKVRALNAPRAVAERREEAVITRRASLDRTRRRMRSRESCDRYVRAFARVDSRTQIAHFAGQRIWGGLRA